MLALKSSGHIRTSRNIRGFRSGKHATGVLLVHFDGARIEFEKEKFALRETRRLWLAKQLSKRPARCR
jgi:hypothetical protein